VVKEEIKIGAALIFSLKEGETCCHVTRRRKNPRRRLDDSGRELISAGRRRMIP